MKINIKKLMQHDKTLNIFIVITVFSFLLVYSSCSVKKYVPEDAMVLKKNIIKIDASDVHTRTAVTASELNDYILLPPNKTTLNFNLWVYNPKHTRIKRWIQGIIDNPPSYYNSVKAEQSEIRINSYLNNRGYFNSKVSHTIATKKNNNQKANATYNIKLARPYSIRAIEYNIPDTIIAKIITPDFFESSVKVGQQYDFYRLDDIRNKITEILRNRGYLFFNSDYVFYEIDSLYKDHTLKVTLNIRPNYVLQQDKNNLGNDLYNRVFYFNDIYVRTNYAPDSRQEQKYDTITFLRPRYQKIHDTLTYHIIGSDPPFMRYKALMPSIYLEQGDLYQEENIKTTRSLISGLSAVGYSNIILDTTSRTLWPDTAHVGLVNAQFDLSKGARQGYNVAIEATNNMGALGTSLNFSYNNNNIFKGSELFTLQFKLATEIQSNLSNENLNYSFLIFNTLEGGIQASFTFPKFLAPFNQYRFNKFFRPRTIISAGYNFQKRPDYERDIFLTTFGYFWKPKTTQSHKLTVLDVNVVKIITKLQFDEQLLSYNNKRLYERYSDHLITASNYTFTYSNQIYGKAKDFVYVQAIAESGGNLLGGISNLVNAPKTTTDDISYYTLLNIRYAQYLKTSVEFRQYKYLGKYSHFAYRTYFGIGIPYGNAISLPFEKSFYAGGANDLRGWGINMVGPGGYINKSKYESSGDLKLVANAEFRFGIANFLKGAVFTDVGNIWLLRKDESFPDGHFDFSNFYKEFYWDAGFGLRLDFGFFIIRVDAAAAIHSPGSQYSTKWVIKKTNFKDIVLNFGIGYPF